MPYVTSNVAMVKASSTKASPLPMQPRGPRESGLKAFCARVIYSMSYSSQRSGRNAKGAGKQTELW